MFHYYKKRLDQVVENNSVDYYPMRLYTINHEIQWELMEMSLLSRLISIYLKILFSYFDIKRFLLVRVEE
jgi:hypothetical protein